MGGLERGEGGGEKGGRTGGGRAEFMDGHEGGRGREAGWREGG